MESSTAEHPIPAPEPATNVRSELFALLGPVSLAFGFWFLLFSPITAVSRSIHEEYFWGGMALATSCLAITAIAYQKREWKRLFHFEKRHVWIGLLHAGFLYGLSRLGVYLVTTLFPSAVPQLASIYATRHQIDPTIIAILLLVVIAPFEEVFWRGLLLDRLLKVFSPRAALFLGVGLYTLVHLWAFNPMLLLAAFVLGAHWSYLYWKFKSLVPGLISHASWDVFIFVILPVPMG